jgi:hypothetical protein
MLCGANGHFPKGLKVHIDGREAKTIQTVKFDTRKGLYDVHE